MPATRGLVLALAIGVLLPGAALGADRPIAGRKLIIKRTASGGEKLVFVSKDPAFLFPAAGGSDDPASGSPGGAQLTLVTEGGESATLVAPAGMDLWRVKPAVFKFADRTGTSDVRVVVLKEGRVLKVVARQTGLALDAPLGAVGVRVTTGVLRSCARFDATTVRTDEAGSFVAKNALASALADCSDASLAGGPSCGASAFPTCGGECPPDGPGCSAFTHLTFGDYCACADCDASGAPCPFGSRCVAGMGCVPIFCTGGDDYPVCGGSCPDGLECGAVQYSDAAFAGCFCGPLGGTCDATCGGYGCGPGEVCVVDTALTSCGCQ